MTMEGPAGKVLLETALPPDLRDPARVWDVSTMRELMTTIALEHPQKYKDVANELLTLGRLGATYSGGYNFSLSDLIPPEELNAYRQEVKQIIRDYATRKGSMDMQDTDLGEKLYDITNNYFNKITKKLEQSGNPIYKIYATGIRGNPTVVKRFLFSEGVYGDSWDRPIPWPVMRNFSEGLAPHEYWAAAYGSKKGIVTTKLAPGDAGFLYKQLAQAAHRLMVVKPDGKSVGQLRGFPVDVDDNDNIGAYLAAPAGGYPAGTLITRKVLDVLRDRKVKKILVRSPIAGGPPEGVYAKDVGARGGSLPDPGALVGLEAAQAIGERISQSSVGKKHQGAVVGGISSATDVINKFLNPPREFKNSAAHAETDGAVSAIVKSPLGGYDIYINNIKHHISSNAEPTVKVGDKVEAGDILSTGFPNPAKIVQYKGIGEGRRYFTKLFTDLLRSFGFAVHRRNTELISRALINHVQFDEKYGNYYPGDITEYNVLEHNWKPRPDAQRRDPAYCKGYYLEEPVLHYTIGTRITPSVIRELKEYNIKSVLVNDKPLPFHALPVQAVEALGYDADWLTKLFGSYQKRSLQEAAAYGGVSNKYRTLSFVPSLVEGIEFGRRWPREALQQISHRG